MAQDQAPEDFRSLVYQCVRRIPRSRVASYGQIAELCGYPRHARMVGSCLKHLQDDTVPWHRVVNARGIISPREAGPTATDRQAELLRIEGVEVEYFGMERRVDMLRYNWSGIS